MKADMHGTVRSVATTIVLAIALVTAPSAAQRVENGAELEPPPGSEVAGSAELDAESPRLVVFTSELMDADGLLAMVRTQLPGWRVQLHDEEPTVLVVERLESELRPEDALLWLEPDDAVVHVVVSGREGRALSSPIPVDTAGEDRNRVYALAAVGLLNELWAQRRRLEAYEESAASIRNRELDELRRSHEEDVRQIARLSRSRQTLSEEVETLRARRSRRSPLSSSGRSFRLGWAQGFSPRHDYYSYGGRREPTVRAWPTMGARISLAGRFDGRFQVGGSLVSLHARDVWNGSLNAFASVHSRTRYRVGLTAEVGLLVGKESDENSGIDTSWASIRLYLPLEVGVVVSRRGGIFVKLGPLITRTPDRWFIGYDISVEWEFD